MTDGAWSVLNKIILTVDVCTSLAASYASGYCTQILQQTSLFTSLKLPMKPVFKYIRSDANARLLCVTIAFI